ncbi:MAG TPA: RNA polymerase factor sigma-54 [Xanthobacteraceae bacterium]|jgi:RNA polymerase sigma-54 factor
MALTQRLELRQSHALVMTPQLMQAIKLLQLSNLDLTSYVDEELERNPLLERVGEADHGGNGSGPPGMPAGEAIPGRDEPHLAEARNGSSSHSISDDVPRYSQWADAGRGRAEENNLEAWVSASATLGDHLAAQLALAINDPARRIIGQYLIDLVDESGYLAGDLGMIADKLGAPPAEIDAVITVLQSFDPPGVCARNLAECLAIQLKEHDRFDPAMEALVGHLDLLARRELPALRKICGVSDEDLADMIDEIRRLNPKPGLAFGSVVVQPVVPDVFVRERSDGGFMVELNSDTLPKVLVNQDYHAEVVRTAKSEHDKGYLANCLQTATWLVRALDQRAKTILKVATEIVRQQDGFFVHGVQHLRPLNLKTIADAIGMHESTVSRVTANKYMATSRGIFELKYFFTSAIAAAGGGEAHSAEAVRHRIRQLIQEESPDRVLSDETIVEELHGAGVEIARRTVAKYREAMRIPSSMQRKREKRSTTYAF